MSSTVQWTLADYERMGAAGVFDGRGRIELIHGEVREMSPIGTLHIHIVMRLTRWSCSAVSEDEAKVMVQSTLRIPALESAPEPDLAWLRSRDYAQDPPTAADVLLLVEAADTSLEYDRGEKADLYAAAGIADYWLLDLEAKLLEVRRDPVHGRYRTLTTYSGDEEVRPLAFPHVALRPSMLW
jgi:Uma2 family endonuclease